MKKILFVVSIVSFLLVGCAGSFKSQVTKGYLPPQGDQIAMTYLDHADINISNKAT